MHDTIWRYSKRQILVTSFCMVRLNGFDGAAFSIVVHIFFNYISFCLAPDAIACGINFRHFQPLKSNNPWQRRHFSKYQFSIFFYCSLSVAILSTSTLTSTEILEAAQSIPKWECLFCYHLNIIVIIMATAVVDKMPTMYLSVLCSLGSPPDCW